MSKPHFVHVFVVLVLISCLVLAGCGTSAGDSKEPPDYSPLQVLVPKAPGKKIVGNSPLNSGYLQYHTGLSHCCV